MKKTPKTPKTSKIQVAGLLVVLAALCVMGAAAMSMHQQLFLLCVRNKPPTIPTARDYVQNGLVAMWDGIENAGWGVHDPNATVWKDLVGTRTISLDSVYQTITEKGVIFNNSPSVGGQLSSGIDDILSCELCATVTRNSPNSILFLSMLGGAPIKACVWYSGGSVGAGANKKGYPVAIGDKFTICAGAPLLKDFAPIALNGVSQIGTGASDYFSGYNQLGFGFRSIYQYGGEVYSLRVYNRVLAAAEIAANYAIDKARFNLP